MKNQNKQKASFFLLLLLVPIRTRNEILYGYLNDYNMKNISTSTNFSCRCVHTTVCAHLTNTVKKQFEKAFLFNQTNFVLRQEQANGSKVTNTSVTKIAFNFMWSILLKWKPTQHYCKSSFILHISNTAHCVYIRKTINLISVSCYDEKINKLWSNI